MSESDAEWNARLHAEFAARAEQRAALTRAAAARDRREKARHGLTIYAWVGCDCSSCRDYRSRPQPREFTFCNSTHTPDGRPCDRHEGHEGGGRWRGHEAFVFCLECGVLLKKTRKKGPWLHCGREEFPHEPRPVLFDGTAVRS